MTLTSSARRLDLTKEPGWAPLTGTMEAGAWQVWIWEEPSLPGEITADATLVAVMDGHLRLAVADPAMTCPDTTDQMAVQAGQTIRSTLRTHLDLDRALDAAAQHLHDPGRRPRLSNLTATVAAVDLSLHEQWVHARRAGDAEVWVRSSGGEWVSLFPASILTPEARRQFDAHPGADLPGAGALAHWQAHLDVLEDPSQWTWPPLGFEYPARIQSKALWPVQELIVATDGACLTPQRCADLHSWLTSGIQRAPEGHRHPSPHGDIAVLYASARGS
jgi:hypothetical protein